MTESEATRIDLDNRDSPATSRNAKRSAAAGRRIVAIA